ncbi:cation:proton antiporter [Saprospiraceae bacterium]|nr:cation:proton antiporter [Saprospiraceae bacterium]|tara:strand:+ start:2332 stop:3642 length:1311 start_codon:yes stop_codon:yes gene_type:complete
MEVFSTYNAIIAASSILILSFFFGEIAKKTNVPSVLMLIVLGLLIQFGVKESNILGEGKNLEQLLLPVLKLLGTVGVIMIVLEAALELKLEKDKYWSIAKALAIALVCLLSSTYVAALILHYTVDGMTMQLAMLYATPLSILSSAIIIPSVTSLEFTKKEFHIYESTFSDILGIMLFYYLLGDMEPDHAGGLLQFSATTILTLVLAFVASYLIIFIFQHIKSHTKLFLLIAVLLLLYAIAKKFHLSSLIIILVFGLVIANMGLFFRGKLGKYLVVEKANQIYEGLHVITLETAFVVRTFFFVIFGITITLSSMLSFNVALISLAIIASIYIIRWVILTIFFGKDTMPQVFIGPRGLITILLFYSIPDEMLVPGFDKGILLFVIIVTSLIMTWALISDNKVRSKIMRQATSNPIETAKWKAPSVTPVVKEKKDGEEE